MGFLRVPLYCKYKVIYMENLPLITSIVFIGTTVITIWMFNRAANKSLISQLIISAWLLLQSLLSLSGFYKPLDTIPPRIIFQLLPPLLFIMGLFSTTGGRRFIDQLNRGQLVLLHIVRIPVELVLYSLYLDKQVPELMTFEGGNYDILSGLTAPVIYWLGFAKKILNRKIILAWNFICLGLLLSIVTHAILSAPTVFQKLAFSQPNITILHFPYALLPAVIVPLVLFSHLATIRNLLKN